MPDMAGVVQFALGYRRTGDRPVDVRAHVAGVGLCEGGDQVGLAVQIIRAADGAFPVVGRKALVVSGDEPVAIGHARAMGGEQMDGAHGAVAPVDTHERGVRVDPVREERFIRRRVAVERRWRTIDAGALQLAVRQRHLGGRHIVVRMLRRFHNSVDDCRECRRPETTRRQVV